MLNLGYGRPNEIPNNCMSCKNTGKCIDYLCSSSEDKNELLKKYLTKTIDLECTASGKDCKAKAFIFAKKIADALISTELQDLIDILKKAESREPVTKDNIPQYGDLSIAMYLVPEILSKHEHSGYIDFGKKIFYREEKNDDAYRKYAENHCKLAAQLDLAVIKKKYPHGYEISSSVMGRYFSSLPIEEKDALLPRLCLRIPIVQEAIISDDRQASVISSLSILSPSTIVRRKKGIIDLVEFAIDE